MEVYNNRGFLEKLVVIGASRCEHCLRRITVTKFGSLYAFWKALLPNHPYKINDAN